MADMLRLTVPEGTLEARLRYVHAVRELCRREHNARGREYLDGKLTEVEFRDYEADVWRRRKGAIAEAVARIHASLAAEMGARPDADAELAAIDLGKAFEGIA